MVLNWTPSLEEWRDLGAVARFNIELVLTLNAGIVMLIAHLMRVPKMTVEQQQNTEIVATAERRKLTSSPV